ncbi:unnamed protein product [Gordionus sp. m RMFG-2023]
MAISLEARERAKRKPDKKLRIGKSNFIQYSGNFDSNDLCLNCGFAKLKPFYPSSDLIVEHCDTLNDTLLSSITDQKTNRNHIKNTSNKTSFPNLISIGQYPKFLVTSNVNPKNTIKVINNNINTNSKVLHDKIFYPKNISSTKMVQSKSAIPSLPSETQYFIQPLNIIETGRILRIIGDQIDKERNFKKPSLSKDILKILTNFFRHSNKKSIISANSSHLITSRVNKEFLANFALYSISIIIAGTIYNQHHSNSIVNTF